MKPEAFHFLTQWIVGASRANLIKVAGAVGSTRVYPLAHAFLDAVGVDFSKDKAALFFDRAEWLWVRWFERYSFDPDRSFVNLFNHEPFIYEGVSYDIHLTLPVSSLPRDFLLGRGDFLLACIGTKHRSRPLYSPLKALPGSIQSLLAADAGFLLIDQQRTGS